MPKALQAEGSIGIGGSLFGPSGLSGRFLLNNKMSVDTALGLSSNRFHLHGSFLYNIYSPGTNSGIFAGPNLFSWSIYSGMGLIFLERENKTRDFFEDFFSDSYLLQTGLRIPLGFSLFFGGKKNIEAYTELSGNIFFGKNKGTDVLFALGCRYYF